MGQQGEREVGLNLSYGVWMVGSYFFVELGNRAQIINIDITIRVWLWKGTLGEVFLEGLTGGRYYEIKEDYYIIGSSYDCHRFYGSRT